MTTTVNSPSPLQTSDIFLHTWGPRTSDGILVIVEAPLSSSALHELRKLFAAAKLDLDQCTVSAIYPERTPYNDLSTCFHSTSEKRVPFRGAFPNDQLRAGIERIGFQLKALKPRLVIGCGDLPLWAFTDKGGVSSTAGYKLPSGASKWRGSQIFTTVDLGNIPYLPVYSPEVIVRMYAWRHVVIHDLASRAKRYLHGTYSWHRQHRTINYWNPSHHEVLGCLNRWLDDAHLAPLELCVDIETWRRKALVCVGLADDKTELCIPFFHFDEKGNCIDYFTEEHEVAICLLLRQLLTHPNIRIIGQNYIYDFQFLSRILRIHTPVSYDTMLMHHLLWPGTPKGLDYLASLYTNHYVYWKDESNDWDGGTLHTELWKYNCKDVRETYDIAQELKKQISAANMHEQWSFQLDQWQVAAEMMQRGIATDLNRLNTVRTEMTKLAEELEVWLLDIMPEDLRFTAAEGYWFQSPKQTMHIFYTILGLPTVLHKKTKKPTANYESFATLKKRAPWLSQVFDKLEEYRSIGVFNSHFLSITLSPDKRLRCNFNVGGTETFRWSSSANAFGEGTNFQNIPKGDEK
jgi:hypothetical protein